MKELLRNTTVVLLAACIFSVAEAPVFAQELAPVELRPALNADNSSEEYLLGPGDVLLMTDTTNSTDGRPLTLTAPILPDGNASIFPIGIIRAGGKSLRALEEEIRQRYAAVAKSPEFVIGIAQTRPVEVYVLGEVVNPGRYRSDSDSSGRQLMLSATPFSGAASPNAPPAPHKSGVLDYLLPFSPAAAVVGAITSNAPVAAAPTQNRRFGGDAARILSPTTMTAITAIQLAGGVKENADIKHIIVRRRNHPPIAVDLWALLVEGDASKDVILKPDDVLLVPKGDLPFKAESLGITASQSRVVKVFGGVNQPGIYELSPQDDVLSIVSRAGGFKSTAVTSKVWLSRRAPDGRVITRKVSISRTMKNVDTVGRSPLASGDILQVKESIVKKVAPQALTIGGAFFSAFMILYLSRRIVDQSQPQTSTSSGGLNQSNGGPLGLPSVF